MPVREINKELAKVAKEELGEDPARIEKDLSAIKDWIAKQDYLNARTDDQWLIAFLRGCKYSLERTKEKLDNYYTMKTMLPELANGVDPFDPVMQELFKSGFFVLLPKPASSNGPRVLLCRIGVYDSKKFDVAEVLKFTYLFTCVQMLEDDQTTIAGQLVVTDSTDIVLRHMAHMTPTNVKKLVMTRQDSLPIRQKGVHHIKNVPGLETCLNLFKTFLTEKNRQRLHAHGTMEDFYKYVPKEILPKEYGGDGGPIDDMIDLWKSKIESYKQWFLEDVQYKTDESKRPGKPKTPEGMFGVEGSFRQLAID